MRPDTPSPSARSPYHGQPKSVWSATTTSPDRSCSPSSSSSLSSTTTATSLPSSYYQVCSPLSPTLPGMPVSDHSRSHPLKNHHSFSTLSGHQKETSTSVPLKPSLLSYVWPKQQKQVYSFKACKDKYKKRSWRYQLFFRSYGSLEERAAIAAISLCLPMMLTVLHGCYLMTGFLLI